MLGLGSGLGGPEASVLGLISGLGGPETEISGSGDPEVVVFFLSFSKKSRRIEICCHRPYTQAFDRWSTELSQ